MSDLGVWRKSSRSDAKGACVEVAASGPTVAVRDSKQHDGPQLQLEPRAFGDLLGAIRTGLYDL